MFPPIASRDSIVSDDVNPLTEAYRDVVIYDEPVDDDPLYEGPIVVHANGWIELEGNRLLSPSAVHHIDIYDGEVTGSRAERDDSGVDQPDDRE
ncbi:hypothetical protein HTZ84_03490 [Haloterrigena sp. SYSU A558-1]|uniref:Uncharacterized protein n=1 Tax=Haloterrigena gelatinilytica TaxID=2741724 RepID=A0A8J8GSJ3_9EURY|nr:hypothetical protein [Haloterrigena gelatinilytica]NUB92705.1 hypothetical protein [Haloterrigena gelatinilytica]NUC71379.1 hypothetical protein [Haloterrigena gelatinilytica]